MRNDWETGRRTWRNSCLSCSLLGILEAFPSKYNCPGYRLMEVARCGGFPPRDKRKRRRRPKRIPQRKRRPEEDSPTALRSTFLLPFCQLYQLLSTSTLDRRSIGGKQISECIYANGAASGFGLACFLQNDVALAKLATLMFSCLAGNEKINTVGTLVGFPSAC